MKAEELRIGNIVLGVLTKRLVVVDWLVLKHIQDDGNIQSIYLPDGGGKVYEPIPISLEVLQKAGFKKHKCGTGCQDMWAGMDGWSIKGSSVWLFRGSPNCLHLVGYFNTQIQYVHQLQNIFAALTGEELEINL